MVCLVDCRVSVECISKLKSYGYEVLSVPPADYLSPPVASHPDMMVFSAFKKIFCHERYYTENKALMDKIASGRQLVLSSEETGDEYPHDVLFNCVILGGHLLCNQNTVSRLILNEGMAHGLEILHTNQGYTKCSVCKVSEEAVITSDRSIYGACSSAGMDCLFVREGHVALEGYAHGFIGGATGCDGENVYFCGDMGTHPDAEAIKDFCKRHGKEAISLGGGPLFDCGSILFV